MSCFFLALWGFTPFLQAAAGTGEQAIDGRPIYIALVDLTCSLDFLELVKSGLLAALEAVPPAAQFGLVTFSHKVKSMHVASSSCSFCTHKSSSLDCMGWLCLWR